MMNLKTCFRQLNIRIHNENIVFLGGTRQQSDGKKPPPPPKGPPSPPKPKGPPRKQPPPPMTKEQRLARPTRKVSMDPDKKSYGDSLLTVNKAAATLSTFNVVDLQNWVELEKAKQSDIKSKHGVQIGYFAACVKAAVDVIKKRPVVNTFIEEKDVVYRNYIDLCVSIATPKGVVTPVIKSAESMNCAQIQKAIAGFEESGSKGSIDTALLKGGTFTIYNGGNFGSMLGTNTLYTGQCASLTIHNLREMAVAVKKKVEIRPTAYIGLTYDHRIIDGREAVLFLKDIKLALETPEAILKGL